MHQGSEELHKNPSLVVRFESLNKEIELMKNVQVHHDISSFIKDNEE